MVDKKLFIWIISLILFELLCSLIFLDGTLKDFFFDNLLAEMLGVLIEILIIIFIFDAWENNKQDKKNIIYEKRLREYLLFFLKNAFKNLPKDINVSRFYGVDYLENKKEIEQIINYISNNNVDLLDAKKHLLTDKTAFENLLEVASHLTDSHFKAWIRIVYFINILSSISDDKNDEIKKYIIDILNNIKKFDKASHESEIYVDAKKSYTYISKKNISLKVILSFIIVLIVNISIFFYKSNNEIEIVDKQNITRSVVTQINENNIMAIVNEINYIYIIVFSFFLLFIWLFYKNYKGEIVNLKQIIYSLILSFLLSISGTITFKILSIHIKKIGFDTNITINNYKDFENKNDEVDFKYLRTLPPLYIFFEKGLILNNGKCINELLIEDNKAIWENEKCIENLKNIFHSTNNKYLIKLTGYSSLERVKDKNRMNNNYDISIGRANNIKNLLLNITDEKQIERKNIVIDIFGNSNQDAISKSHYLNRKVKIEIIELEPIKKNY